MNFTNVSGVAPNVNKDGTLQASSGAVNSSEFLQLLVTQLKNQDPTQPTDDTQMLSQLAQFSSLEQMQNLNQNLSASTQFSQLSQSAALIGKTVTAGTAASPVTGTVASVTVQGTKTLLHIGDQDVDAATVSEIQ